MVSIVRFGTRSDRSSCGCAGQPAVRPTPHRRALHSRGEFEVGWWNGFRDTWITDMHVYSIYVHTSTYRDWVHVKVMLIDDVTAVHGQGQGCQGYRVFRPVLSSAGVGESSILCVICL